MEELSVEWNLANPEEIAYKNAGFTKTKGTVFVKKIPTDDELKRAFNENGDTSISVGARFLQKHFHRNGSEIYGNILQKNQFASQYLETFLNGPISWKNIHQIGSTSNSATILEIRNDEVGFRWYILDDGKCIFRGVLQPYPTYLQFKQACRVLNP